MTLTDYMCQEEREEEDLSASNISYEKTLMWQRKGNLTRETWSLLIAALNNVIRTNYIKARIDKMPQNSRCRLCIERDETINHILSECSKLAQKEYKTRPDWVGKAIHRELCKKLKFDYANKWYMRNPASILENETRKLLRYFEIQAYHRMSSTRPDLIVINKKKRSFRIVDFAVPAAHRMILEECEKRISTLTLQGNRKICVIWKWWLYQL